MVQGQHDRAVAAAVADGPPVRMLARRLAAAGLGVQVTPRRDTCELAICGTGPGKSLVALGTGGQARWYYEPPAGPSAGPAALAAIIGHLLGAPPDPASLAPYRALPVKGQVGRSLQDRGLAVSLRVSLLTAGPDAQPGPARWSRSRRCPARGGMLPGPGVQTADRGIRLNPRTRDLRVHHSHFDLAVFLIVFGSGTVVFAVLIVVAVRWQLHRNAGSLQDQWYRARRGLTVAQRRRIWWANMHRPSGSRNWGRPSSPTPGTPPRPTTAPR